MRRNPKTPPKDHTDPQTNERFHREYCSTVCLFTHISYHFIICLDVRAGKHLRHQGWVCERENYHSMSNAKQTRRLPRALRETLITMLETLPGALFVLDDAETIVYANASAQTLTGATAEHFVGATVCPDPPHPVTTSLSHP